MGQFHELGYPSRRHGDWIPTPKFQSISTKYDTHNHSTGISVINQRNPYIIIQTTT